MAQGRAAAWRGGAEPRPPPHSPLWPEPLLAELDRPSLPRYTLPPRAGLVNSAILYPITRALFDAAARFPLAIDSASPPRMAERLAASAQRFTTQNQPDALLWPVAEAAVAGYKSADTDGGRAHPARSLPSISTALLALVAGSLFADIDSKAAYWQRPACQPPRVPISPAQPRPAGPGMKSCRCSRPSASPTATCMRSGRWCCRRNRCSASSDFRRMTPRDFRMPDSLWARIVYDFILAYRLRTINRGHLLGALTPLYLAWVASHLLLTLHVDPAEAHIEAVAAAFEVRQAIPGLALALAGSLQSMTRPPACVQAPCLFLDVSTLQSPCKECTMNPHPASSQPDSLSTLSRHQPGTDASAQHVRGAARVALSRALAADQHSARAACVRAGAGHHGRDRHAAQLDPAPHPHRREVRRAHHARNRPAASPTGRPAHSPTALVGRIAFWACVLLGLIIGISAFDASYASGTPPSRVSLLPYLTRSVGAILLLFAGNLIARFLARTVLIGAVNNQLQYARFLSMGVKWLVLVLTAAMVLDHLQIGGTIVELAFGILFGGIVLTLSLAIGLGSRDLVSRSLDRSVDTFDRRHGAPAEGVPSAQDTIRHF